MQKVWLLPLKKSPLYGFNNDGYVYDDDRLVF